MTRPVESRASMPDTEALLATVRGALENGNPAHEDAWFALDIIASELEQVRAERDELAKNLHRATGLLSAVEIERDEWKETAHRESEGWMLALARQARLDRAMETLRKIAYLPQDYPPDELLPQIRIARAALVEIEGSA